jgi:hypothetical protein
MVVVGLDRERVAAELARLVSVGGAEVVAVARARALDLRPAGAAEAIVAALEGDLGDTRS